ncbi:hypothetical protein K435DRAFT_44440 [Dendrothele bispora CBS 962.96]|uniref:HIT domain-containing protein n=1 Tax=Dendrothele bispora (strain CBS 962.96) TaxID=1314807 RepID=A0A4S8MSG3_DENBC|nr:hypothetical protein K435DRAFT_44440 [Dendrothele bispora CBS 962.96]
MMDNNPYRPRTGCPLCGVVAKALEIPINTPCSSTTSDKIEILWRDENFTAYREHANPVSSKAHVIIAFNLHVPSIYNLSSSDLPLLVNIRNLAHRLLSSLNTPSSTTTSPRVPTFPSSPLNGKTQFRIGFITSPFKDNKIPITDHLHVHAYIEPADLLGWWRGIAYTSVAWYGIDDLIAEIRETVSNNRVKSGYDNRRAPIDQIPEAGSRTGTPNGIETTKTSLSRPEHNQEGGQS